MRLATLRSSDGSTSAVRIDKDHAVPVEGFADVGQLLRDPRWRELARADASPTCFSPTDLAPVVPHPEKIICVGLNYAAHIAEMGHERPDVPTLFIKFADALIGPYDDVEVPARHADSLDFEGELAVVLGATAHHLSEDEAGECIAGYTIINDYTQRHYQKRTQQWHQGKSLEKTAGFGPWIDTEFTPGPRLSTRLNGEIMQDAPTDDLVFSPEMLISFISQLYPLNPGDVIATGTPAGVLHAREPKRYLGVGDTVRVEVAQLGAIENTTRVV